MHVYTDGGLQQDPSVWPKGQGNGGIGIVIARDGGETVVDELARHFPGPVTSQQMELRAALFALDMLHSSGYTFAEHEITIFSDSAYLVNCFKDGWWVRWMTRSGWKNNEGKPVENAELWRGLIQRVRSCHDALVPVAGPSPWRRLASEQDAAAIRAACEHGLDVRFAKVKGHRGVPLNERADELATLGKLNQPLN